MCPIIGNQVIISPATIGRSGASQKAEFDNTCLIPYLGGFPRTVKHKVMLKEGATKCVSFKGSGDQAPSCSINDVNEFSKASVIRLSGQLRGENKTFIYILLFIIIILSVISILMGSGRIRL